MHAGDVVTLRLVVDPARGGDRVAHHLVCRVVVTEEERRHPHERRTVATTQFLPEAPIALPGRDALVERRRSSADRHGYPGRSMT
jgi:hypothetical protein